MITHFTARTVETAAAIDRILDRIMRVGEDTRPLDDPEAERAYWDNLDKDYKTRVVPALAQLKADADAHMKKPVHVRRRLEKQAARRASAAIRREMVATLGRRCVAELFRADPPRASRSHGSQRRRTRRRAAAKSVASGTDGPPAPSDPDPRHRRSSPPTIRARRASQGAA